MVASLLHQALQPIKLARMAERLLVCQGCSFVSQRNLVYKVEGGLFTGTVRLSSRRRIWKVSSPMCQGAGEFHQPWGAASNAPFAKNSGPDKPRGGLPRFHVETLPSSEGAVITLQGTELFHMAKALRIGAEDCIELFDGRGGLVEARVLRVDRASAQLAALHSPQRVAPWGPQWSVVAACGTLKGGRADWLVEKCTELGAAELVPMLTERSPRAGEGRIDRWQRVALAAAKQCQRLHDLQVREPLPLSEILQQVREAPLALLASAESPPLLYALHNAGELKGGMLLVGPEGDFTEEELRALLTAGAVLVGLGPRRLRVETAAIAMLAGLMLAGDSQQVTAGRSQ